MISQQAQWREPRRKCQAWHLLSKTIMTVGSNVSIIPLRQRPGLRGAATFAPGGIASFPTLCSSCNLRKLCRPCNVTSANAHQRAGQLNFARVCLSRGDCLYLRGERADVLYALRSGFLKLKISQAKGGDKVVGYALGGETVGLNDVASGVHTCDCVALEKSEVCVVSPAPWHLARHDRSELLELYSKALRREPEREQSYMLRLGGMDAEERIAYFLLDFARRQSAHGRNAAEFYLPLTRSDVGSYLDLKPETIRRASAGLQLQGWIGINRGRISIRNRAGLERLLGLAPTGAAR